MKKFLLSLAVAMTGVFGLSAQTTVTAADVNLTEAKNIGGFTVEVKKNDGTTAPAYHEKTGAIRLYAKGTLTVSGGNMSKIVFTLASDAAYRYTTFTPSTGALNPAQAAGDTEITWEGNTNSVTFTVGDFATMGTDGETKAGQIRFASFTIYGEGGGDTPVDPNPNPNPEPTPDDQQYTVADVLAMDVASLSGANAWVKGYVVGSFNGKATSDFSAEAGANASASNLAIAAAAGETDVTKMVAVQLPAGDVRTALNLKDNAAMLGKEVNLYGTLEKYFGIHGLKNVTKYDVTGGVPEVEVKETATLTSFIDEQDENNFYKILGAVTVVYQSGNYLFITDGTSNLEVYGKLDKTYKNGDQLTGIVGKFGYYMNMPQMAPKAESFGEATEGTAVTPAETTLDKVQLAQYVTVKNVKVVADGDKWNVTDGTTTLQLFNRFNIEGIKGLEGTTITGIGAVYDETKQLFPITIEGGTETGETPEPPVVEPGDGISIAATDFAVGGDEATATKDGFTVTLAKNDGTTAPAYHEKTGAIRLYAKGTLTVAGGNMSKIVFTLASDAAYRYTEFTPSTGALNPAQAAGDTEITWEGNANNVTFTVGDFATMGTDGDTKAGQIRFTKVTIYGEAGAISEIRFDENGSMVIYNLRGQRLSAPVKGINIINGKKVLVK